MPSTYTGDPTATQAPSPAPSFGSTTQGDPKGSLPTDGDPPNADSVAQMAKVPLDWIAFFRRAFHGWTDITANVSASAGSNPTGSMRLIGDMKVAVVAVSNLPYNAGAFTITVGGSRLSGAKIVLATAQSTSGSDEPVFAKADETSGDGTSRTYTVRCTTVAQGHTAAVQLLIIE